MSEHQWKLGQKEVRSHLENEVMKGGFYVDICKVCGVGLATGASGSMYIPATQVQTFLTTDKPVDAYYYFPCGGVDVEDRTYYRFSIMG